MKATRKELDELREANRVRYMVAEKKLEKIIELTKSEDGVVYLTCNDSLEALRALLHRIRRTAK